MTSTDHWLQPLVTDFNRAAIARAIIFKAGIYEGTRLVSFGRRTLYRMEAIYSQVDVNEFIVETLSIKKYQQIKIAYEEMLRWPYADLMHAVAISESNRARKYRLRRQPGPRKFLAMSQ